MVRPAEIELTALADLLNSAKRVTLFCGRGCAGSHPSLMKLAEILKSPIVHALGGKDHVEYDNPYDVGMTGFIGFSSGYAAMHACDVLLMLGTDFPYKQFLPDEARIAQVDIRPENLGRRCKLCQNPNPPPAARNQHALNRKAGTGPLLAASSLGAVHRPVQAAEDPAWLHAPDPP